MGGSDCPLAWLRAVVRLQTLPVTVGPALRCSPYAGALSNSFNPSSISVSILQKFDKMAPSTS